jgi:uncharacterized repeat protein (TIGR03803 family)
MINSIMNRKTRFAPLREWLLTLLLALLSAPCAKSQTKFQIVHAFGAPGDVEALYSQVVLDQSGNIYGAGAGGGAYGQGAVFELSPDGSGAWIENILYNFGESGKADGSYPYGPVTLGIDGIIYGTTTEGGAFGYGSLYSLTLGSAGWKEAILHNFGHTDPIAGPSSNLTQDATGNLYGEAGRFQLSKGKDGWVFRLICFQKSGNGDVCSGNDYDGTTLGPKAHLFSAGLGGTHGVGNVYEAVPTPGGWDAMTLFNFGSSQYDGQVPAHGPLVADRFGNIYGATFAGGLNNCGNGNCGTIYKLARQPDGQWKETILFNFGSGSTGFNPIGGVILDKAGNLYGTTGYGGGACGCGVAYRLSPNQNGTWTYAVLHAFDGFDGALPYSSLTMDSKGNLYGTTVGSGPYGGGVVFEITP